MTSFKDIWLEKIAEEVPHHEHAEYAKKNHKHPEYAKKDHKHPEYTTKPEVEEIAEEAVEKHEDRMHKSAAQASEVLNSSKPVLVVTYAGDDQASKMFVQNLDKVLGSSSGLDRLQIKAFSSMKDSNAVKQLKAPGIGIALYRNGKLVDSLGNANEQAIRKFIDANKKNLI